MNKELYSKLIQQSMEPNGVEGLGGPYMEVNPEKLIQETVIECMNIFEAIENGNRVGGTYDYSTAVWTLFFKDYKG